MIGFADVVAEETLVIDPAKAAQLRRMEPLTNDKVNVFVEAGQLTPTQAEFVKRHIGAGGKLALPQAAIAPEPRRAVLNTAPQPVPSRQAPPSPAAPPASSGNPYSPFNYKMPVAEQDRLRRMIAEYRHGNRPAIGRELRQFRPAVNQLVAEAYLDAIDLPCLLYTSDAADE